MKRNYLVIELTPAQSRRARKAIAWYRDWAGSGVRRPVYAELGMFELYGALLAAERAAEDDS